MGRDEGSRSDTRLIGTHGRRPGSCDENGSYQPATKPRVIISISVVAVCVALPLDTSTEDQAYRGEEREEAAALCWRGRTLISFQSAKHASEPGTGVRCAPG